jgi:hypothetical protein
MLTVVLDQRDGWWSEASVSEVRAVTVVSVELAVGEITVVLELDARAPTSGSFTLAGRLQTVFGKDCAVRRSFQFSTDGQSAQIALVGNDLPKPRGGGRGRRILRSWA